jgi:membrane protein implicated in regulation of membrane protease activity
MSQSTPSTRRPSPGLWVLIVVILLPAVILPLWVPLYDKTDPRLWGFPFFYWFQFAMIPVVSLLTFVAFRLSLSATAKDRPTFGLPAEPESPEGER